MTIERAIDILDKWEFFYGQRAGRELWADKPKEVQDKDIADFCRDLGIVREALERTRWIPCSERLPDLKPRKAGTAYTYSDAVYVWTTGGKAMTGIWDGITWIAPFPFWDAWEERITHWKPIYPPKEEQDETD